MSLNRHCNGCCLPGQVQDILCSCRLCQILFHLKFWIARYHRVNLLSLNTFKWTTTNINNHSFNSLAPMYTPFYFTCTFRLFAANVCIMHHFNVMPRCLSKVSFLLLSYTGGSVMLQPFTLHIAQNLGPLQNEIRTWANYSRVKYL